MLKKIFKAVTAFILLVGCYLGYVRAFAVVVEQFRASRRIDINAFAAPNRSPSGKRSSWPRPTSGTITGAPTKS